MSTALVHKKIVQGVDREDKFIMKSMTSAFNSEGKGTKLSSEASIVGLGATDRIGKNVLIISCQLLYPMYPVPHPNSPQQDFLELDSRSPQQDFLKLDSRTP